LSTQEISCYHFTVHSTFHLVRPFHRILWPTKDQWNGLPLSKGCRRLNTVEMLRTYVCKWKDETCCNYSRDGVRRDKGERWRGWIQLWCIIRTFVNVTMYPQNSNNKKKKEKNPLGMDYLSLYWTTLHFSHLVTQS
jgi:hypothetical protein